MGCRNDKQTDPIGLQAYPKGPRTQRKGFLGPNTVNTVVFGP